MFCDIHATNTYSSMSMNKYVGIILMESVWRYVTVIKKATLYSSIKSTAIAHLYYWTTLYFCCFSYKKRSEVIWGTHNNTAPVYCHPSAPPQLRHCIVSSNKPTNNKVEDPLFGEMARWGEREERECVSESLNSGPLPGSGIDCRVQRMALTLRYHYSSIDRPALKSKSHLVAQAGVSGSGDHGVCVCVCVCVYLCGAWCAYVEVEVLRKCLSLVLCHFPRLHPLISSFSLYQVILFLPPSPYG